MYHAAAHLRLIVVAVELVVVRIDTATYRQTRLLLGVINEIISESTVNVT